MKKRYVIPGLYGNNEIIDPTIEIVGYKNGNPAVLDIDFPTKKYSVEIRLIVPGATLAHVLTNVQAESLNFDAQANKMMSQVIAALDQQYLI